MRLSRHRMDRNKDLIGQSVKEPKKDLLRQRKFCRDRINMLKKQIFLRQTTACCNRDLQQRIKTLSQQHFQVATKNAIWARILGIHNVASNLEPKLLGLYKYKHLRKARQSVGRKTRAFSELRTLLYYIFIFILFYFYFLCRLDLA